MITFDDKITIGDLLTILGWTIVFFYTFFQIKKTHKFNIEAQNLLFKQEIEYKSYLEIQKNLDKYSTAVIDYQNYLQFLQIDLKFKRYSKIKEIPSELSKRNSDLSETLILFMESYEIHEIIVMEFEPLKNAIAKEYALLSEKMNELDRIFFEKRIDNLGPDEIQEIIDKIKSVMGNYWNSVGYIRDFRIEMQNKILSPVLGKKVPKRQPESETEKVLSLD